MHSHTPLLQVCPPEQLPQLPPQALGPQFLPAQFGAQHVPVVRQLCPDAHGQSVTHVEQFSPESHWLFPQKTDAWHVPVAEQFCPLGQLPQLPPHPSSPQIFPLQLGEQHVPFMHFAGLAHRQSLQPVHVSPSVGSHTPLPQLG